MTQTQQRAGWRPMDRQSRGEALRQRMVALNLDVSKLARAVGRQPNTITSAFKGKSRDITYDQLEAWFDREERKQGMVPLQLVETPTAAPERQLATIRLEEGGALVVQGPLESDEDERRMANLGRELIREWRATRPPSSDTPDQ